MARKLPPLNPLRAFEASARHLSFTKAADELFVTQAAISHQIKTLEEQLNVRLFRRLNRALLLTEEGQLFLTPVREALDILAGAVEKLSRQESSGALTVDVMPSFATAWLVPRLASFRKAHPDIDLRISANYNLTDFNKDDVDVVLRWGKGNYPGLRAVRFMEEDIFPMCSPRLLDEGAHPLCCPDDLKYHTLLHDEMETDWRMWLLAARVKGVDPDKGVSFNHSNLVIQAAIDGQGVALGRSTIAHDALARGALVKPFDLSLPSEYAFYVVCPEHTADRPKITAFRDWVVAEAEKDALPGVG